VPGRLVVLTALFWLPLVAVQQFTELPALVELFRKVVSFVLFTGLGWLAVLIFARGRRRFLWRVRRKLVLSYVFLGFVPVVLVLLFALAGSVVLYTNIAAYLFHDGFEDIVERVGQIAETAAAEMDLRAEDTQAAVTLKYQSLAAQYPGLSLVVLDSSRDGSDGASLAQTSVVARAGAWRHVDPPSVVPAWLRVARRFQGTLIYTPDGDDAELQLFVRAAVLTARGRLVIADLPVDTDIVTRMQDRTSTRIRQVSETSTGGDQVLFQRTVAFMDRTDWQTGVSSRISVSLDAPYSDVFGRISSAQSANPTFGPPGLDTGGPFGAFVLILILLGLSFLVIQGSALVMGALLGRSITSAVHELFVGTERVRQGDFAHRIKIDSKDQLGDLADSFNRMSGSIEHLLHVQREKQRLDDELRIAREIQKSLLPAALPVMAGMSLADLCEPAREVGGDYYDFFELGPRQLGVLVADVSGKGTSAALYMAELKGLMLGLSHAERSPRRLLIDANRRLAGHLDNRSFITMTYAVIDLERQTLTCARAGHTPLLVVSGGRSELVTPDGMVLGLRLPGAAERFDDLLCEHTQPVAPGDVIVFYTDGITEAMSADGEMFGDQALADLVASQHHLDPAGMRERIVREVRSFVGEAEPHDDMTMVIVKITDEAA
jgi:serine phosphatase RsbU (regulator of sigma subunit)